MLATCPSCQAPIPPDASQCPGCGGDPRPLCPRCGYRCPSESRFCGRCGAALAAAPPDASRGEVPAPDQSLHDSERKLVTVLFADLVGSTSLGEALDPEAYHQVITSLFRRLAASLRAHGGYVEKYIGDSVMAVFGAPIAHEDDAERAIQASRAVHELVDGFGAEWQARIGRRVQVRVGINSGLAIAGRVGEGRAMDYGVLGDVVNAAARLQQAAEPGQTVVGEITRDLANAAFVFEPLPPLTLRGKAQPVRAYVLRGERRLDPGNAPAVVGRDWELGMLGTALAAAREGESAIVSIVGDPGTGKTVLVEELERSAAGNPRFIWLSCLSYRQAQPLWAIGPMLRALAGQSREPAAVCQALVERAGRAEDRLALAVVDAVGAFGAGFATQLDGLDPEVRRTVSVDVLADVLRAPGATTVMLVVDGAHWLDSLSTEVLKTAIERRRGVGRHPGAVGFGCLLAHRRPWKAPWTVDVEIALGPLDFDAADDLLRSTGVGLVDPSLSERLWRASAGNPRFLAELARGSASALEGSDATLPASVRALLLARLDGLGEQARRVVRVASVIGEEFTLESLRIALEADPVGRDRLDLPGILAELIRSDVVARTESVDRYRFRMPLLAEVAYETLLVAERRWLHGRVGHWLEESGCRDVALLAHHYGRGDDDARAGHYLAELGDRQFALGEIAGAMVSYREALDRLDNCSPIDSSERVAIERALARALLTTGAHADAFAILERAHEAASSGIARAETLRQMAEIWSAAGDPDEAARALAQAEAELTTSSGSETVDETLDALAALHATAASLHVRNHNWADAGRSGEQAIELLSFATQRGGAAGEVRVALDAHLALATALSEQGELRRAAEHAAAAYHSADDIGDPSALVRAALVLGKLDTFQGALDVARERYEWSLALAHRTGDQAGEARAAELLAELRSVHGEVDAAIELYRRAAALYDVAGRSDDAARCRHEETAAHGG